MRAGQTFDDSENFGCWHHETDESFLYAVQNGCIICNHMQAVINEQNCTGCLQDHRENQACDRRYGVWITLAMDRQIRTGKLEFKYKFTCADHDKDADEPDVSWELVVRETGKPLFTSHESRPTGCFVS